MAATSGSTTHLGQWGWAVPEEAGWVTGMPGHNNGGDEHDNNSSDLLNPCLPCIALRAVRVSSTWPEPAVCAVSGVEGLHKATPRVLTRC